MQMNRLFRDSLNFRNLGGLKTNDGKTVKDGLFYRSGSLNFFNDKEMEHFKKIGIKTIIDLRSNHEIKQYPDPELEGINFIEYSGLVVKGAKEIDWSPSGMKKIGGEATEQLSKIEHYYTLIAFDNEAFRLMVKEIVEGRVPILFHCASGKDRTGVAAMVVEMLLNVTKEEMRKDYLLSNDYRKEILDESLDEVKQIAKDHPEINTLITMQQGVVERIFDVVMESIENKYKSYDEYIMTEYNLSKEKLEEIRSKYTY